MVVVPGTADDGLIPIGIAGDGAGVDGDDSPAPFEVGFEVLPILAGDIPGFVGMEDEDVGGGELFGSGKVVASGGFRSAFVEEFRPVLEKGGMVVAAGPWVFSPERMKTRSGSAAAAS